MLRRAIASEARKIGARRSTRFLLVLLTVLPTSIALALITLLRGAARADWRWFQLSRTSPQDLLQIVFGTAGLFCGLLGIMTLTSEYGAMTVMRTYQIFRDRYSVLIGKLLVLAGVSLLSNSIAVTLGLVELRALGGAALATSSPGVLAWSFVAKGVITTIFGYGLGLLMSRSVPTILAFVGFLYVLPEVVTVLFQAVAPSLTGLRWYLPTEAAAAPMQKALLGVTYTGPPPATAIAVVLAETLMVVVAGIWIQRHKNIG